MRRFVRSLSLREHITGLILTVVFIALVLLVAGAHEFIKASLVASLRPTFGEETARDVLRQYDMILIAVALLVWIASGLLAWLFSSSAVRPLDRAERAATQIAAGNYRVRLPVGQRSTEINRLNSAVNLMAADIEQAVRARDDAVTRLRSFIADASHEMRTPLVSVRGYAELYRIGALQNEQAVRNAFERIEHEAVRMTDLVEDLLTLTRVGSVERRLDEHVDLQRVVTETVHDAHAREPDRTLTVDSSGPAVVQGSESLLRQVVVNLLSNAMRFSTGAVELHVGCNGTEVQLDVADHGRGIPAAARQRIFERFWRGEQSRARETGGTGLGLSIVLAIVHEHRGRIDVLDTPGGGATFRITLPGVSASGDSSETAVGEL